MRASATAIVLAVAIAACGGNDHDPAKVTETLRPQFEPATTVAPSSASDPTSTATAGTAPTAAAPSTTAPPAAAASAATITDRANDTTPSPADPPPPWADLLGARLTRTPDGFELRVRLGGGEAPAAADDEHTMNVASFYDLDGDGDIDDEVWANVGSGGWGGSYFDDAHGTSAFQEQSGVSVSPEGDEVVIRFPLSHLSGASRFRWSVASEWGRTELVGTQAMVRDDLPDGDAAAAFPT